jgi:2-desacetyl-2-hydroxyethyl bacteriochlorophyllide A dehydrogenase
MKQIVLTEPGRFDVRRAGPAAPGPGEALVRVRRVGLCGTDFHAFSGNQVFFTYPRILGHELSCEVLEVGDDAGSVRPGDRCAIEPYLNCATCRPCGMDRPNCCEQMQVLGVHVDGGMQGMMVVPAALLHKSDKLSFDQLALVEPLGVGAHAVERSSLVAGEEALVIGVGPIGLSVLQFARATGAKVSGMERNEWRRDFAVGLGFEMLLDAEERHFDVVFDATGNAASMSTCLKHVAFGGRLVFVGITKEPLAIDDQLLHRREMTLVASRNSCRQFPKNIRLLEESRIDADSWITHRLELSALPSEILEIRKRRQSLKTLVEVTDDDLN